jgi:hypothetical protein
MSEITGTARGECGVEVTVNLDGMITAVTLTDAALRLGADRLTHQVAGVALALGLDILEPVAGDALLELLVPNEPPGPPAAGDDFATIESWAV